MQTVVTFGEIMLRLATPGFSRFGQSSTLEATFGGGEANVAVSLARFGLPVEYVTRLPANDLGDACLEVLRGYGVGTRHVVRGGRRLGIYFLEAGAAQRGSKVIYDRADSALADITTGMVDWDAVFEGAGWFHWTGITAAVSRGAADECRIAIEAARRHGVTVSCDLNYRKNLWKWGKAASEVMPGLVALCDVAVGNEEDAEKVFGIRAPDVDVTAGNVEADAYVHVCEELHARFANLRSIAVTLRGSLSASHNTWSGLLWHEGRVCRAPVYDIIPIVDRVGGGDAFCAGLIYGLACLSTPEEALAFAVAASCLKHSIPGDLNLVRVDEVRKLMQGDASGRVSR
jgi:2-dehydro-3-deoxygluconokinase